jgi:hypothetical protein
LQSTRSIATTPYQPPQGNTAERSEYGSPNVQQKPDGGAQSEHLNIKVTDNNNEVSFKIKRTTALGKRMNTFCDRQGKNISSERFLFDGQRTTALGKLMDAFCHRQGKNISNMARQHLMVLLCQALPELLAEIASCLSSYLQRRCRLLFCQFVHIYDLPRSVAILNNVLCRIIQKKQRRSKRQSSTAPTSTIRGGLHQPQPQSDAHLPTTQSMKREMDAAGVVDLGSVATPPFKRQAIESVVKGASVASKLPAVNSNLPSFAHSQPLVPRTLW